MKPDDQMSSDPRREQSPISGRSTVAKFRKKPVVIDAVQFHQVSAKEVLAFVGSMWWDNPHEHQPAGLYGAGNGDAFIAAGMWIQTLEGKMNAMPGDWIIKGVKGEFYPIKPDIFAATYEPVSDDQ